MTPRYTPGPWVATNDGRVMTTTGVHRCVADVHDPRRGYPDGWELVVDANARLISAAPDLVEVARAVIELMGLRYPTPAESADMGGLEATVVWAARQALRKAGVKP